MWPTRCLKLSRDSALARSGAEAQPWSMVAAYNEHHDDNARSFPANQGTWRRSSWTGGSEVGANWWQRKASRRKRARETQSPTARHSHPFGFVLRHDAHLCFWPPRNRSASFSLTLDRIESKNTVGSLNRILARSRSHIEVLPKVLPLRGLRATNAFVLLLLLQGEPGDMKPRQSRNEWGRRQPFWELMGVVGEPVPRGSVHKLTASSLQIRFSKCKIFNTSTVPSCLLLAMTPRRHPVGKGSGGLMQSGNFSGAFSFTQSPIWFKANSGKDRCASKIRFTVSVTECRSRPTAVRKVDIVMGSWIWSSLMEAQTVESKVENIQTLPPYRAIASARRPANAWQTRPRKRKSRAW